MIKVSNGENSARIKGAELLSGIGAVLLGAGIGLLFSNLLMPYTTPLLVVGLLTHAWGMFNKHRLESGLSVGRLWWMELLYWVCWLALLVLILYLTVNYLRG
jgi:hypothetical protein